MSSSPRQSAAPHLTQRTHSHSSYSRQSHSRQASSSHAMSSGTTSPPHLSADNGNVRFGGGGGGGGGGGEQVQSVYGQTQSQGGRSSPYPDTTSSLLSPTNTGGNGGGTGGGNGTGIVAGSGGGYDPTSSGSASTTGYEQPHLPQIQSRSSEDYDRNWHHQQQRQQPQQQQQQQQQQHQHHQQQQQQQHQHQQEGKWRNQQDERYGYEIQPPSGGLSSNVPEFIPTYSNQQQSKELPSSSSSTSSNFYSSAPGSSSGSIRPNGGVGAFTPYQSRSQQSQGYMMSDRPQGNGYEEGREGEGDDDQGRGFVGGGGNAMGLAGLPPNQSFRAFQSQSTGSTAPQQQLGHYGGSNQFQQPQMYQQQQQQQQQPPPPPPPESSNPNAGFYSAGHPDNTPHVSSASVASSAGYGPSALGMRGLPPLGTAGQQSQHSVHAPPPPMVSRLSMRGGSVRSGDDEVGLERLGRDGERRRGGRRGERERVVGVQDRERDQMDEEISTIFVVGFPEDMTEREFQNMFTFAAGFEAAMLKVPHAVAAERREKELALASVTQDGPTAIPLSLQQQIAARHTNPASMLVELQGLHEQFNRGSHSVTTSSEDSITPGIIDDAFASQLQQTMSLSSDGGKSRGDQSRDPPLAISTRRQTIGFARFRSRAEALVARDILQGRKIDIFPGSVLKAEMAKKNLHTKRGVAGEEIVGMLVRSGRLPGLLAGMGMGGISSNASVTGMTSGTSTPSGQALSTSVMPSGLPLPGAGSRSATAADSSSRGDFGVAPRGLPLSESGHERQSDWRETSRAVDPQSKPNWAHWAEVRGEEEGDRTVLASDQPSSQQRPGPPEHRRSEDIMRSPLPPPTDEESRRFEQGARRPADSGVGFPSTDPSPESSAASPSDKPKDSKALLALAEEADDLEIWRVGGMDQLGQFDGESRTGTPNHQTIIMGDSAAPGPHYRERQSAPSTYPVDSRESMGVGDPQGPRQFMSLGSSLIPNTKPADQNPPINTLYVGNLPAAPSPSHPPNLLEDSLRHLFGQCVGFKRLSYRQKLTPQCFVEFVDIPSATRAMRELYGHTLNGLVRGGIRIAYSRNPLGQRGSNFSPPSRTVPTPFTSSVSASGPYIPAPLSPSSATSNGLPFAMQYQSTTPGPSTTFRRPSESTPLSPQAPPFSVSSSHSMSATTSPRFNPNGLHSPREYAPVSPPITSTMPWSTNGPSTASTFSAFDAPRGRGS